jgi:hypothetical protein
MYFFFCSTSQLLKSMTIRIFKKKKALIFLFNFKINMGMYTWPTGLQRYDSNLNVKVLKYYNLDEDSRAFEQFNSIFLLLLAFDLGQSKIQ